jgi:hypothetical protein
LRHDNERNQSVMTANEPPAPVPDTKDWSFTATSPCRECGYDPGAIADRDLAHALRDTVSRWSAVLAGPNATVRPAETVWSPLEYACHVRDVHDVFAGRIRRMRVEDSPHFVSWNGDAAAIENHYHAQDPAVVATELATAAEDACREYDAVSDGAWGRDGIRGGGGIFTISTLGHYHLHDVIHHLHDVRG